MSEIKQWHREAAQEIHDNARYLVDMSVSVDKLAERIASHDPSNADRQAVIEKYAELCYEKAYLDSTNNPTGETFSEILTRFANEIGGVDVDRVSRLVRAIKAYRACHVYENVDELMVSLNDDPAYIQKEKESWGSVEAELAVLGEIEDALKSMDAAIKAAGGKK